MRALGLAAVVALLATVPLEAHHSLSAEYDPTKKITLNGAITRVEWSNPHTFLYLTVTTPAGQTETWRIEAGSPNQMTAIRLTREVLAAGSVVVINAVLAKDGSKSAAGHEIILPDGTKFSLMVPPPRPRTATEKVSQRLNSPLSYIIIISVPALVLAIVLYVRRRRAAGALDVNAEARSEP